MKVSELKEYLNKFDDRADVLYLDMSDREYYPLDRDWLKIKIRSKSMTKENFKTNAKEVIDNEQFGLLGNLFSYNDYGDIRVAHISDDFSVESDMALDDFLDKLYEKIKENLK